MDNSMIFALGAVVLATYVCFCWYVIIPIIDRIILHFKKGK